MLLCACRSILQSWQHTKQCSDSRAAGGAASSASCPGATAIDAGSGSGVCHRLSGLRPRPGPGSSTGDRLNQRNCYSRVLDGSVKVVTGYRGLAGRHVEMGLQKHMLHSRGNRWKTGTLKDRGSRNTRHKGLQHGYFGVCRDLIFVRAIGATHSFEAQI